VNPNMSENIFRADLLAFGSELVSACAKCDLNPLVYGSVAVMFHTKDESVTTQDIDFLIPKSRFPDVINFVRSDPRLRFEETTYNSLRVFKGQLKASFDSLEDYLMGMEYQSIQATLAGHKFFFVDRQTLREVYKRGADRIPMKRDAYVNNFKKLGDI
jgi:hypothetical protein